jgi:antitoxin (DNA-binding transcriptional repressor) of toxin-antitoxin stability system
MSDMKTVGVRQISKNWPGVLEQNAGAEVAITSRGQVVAYLRVPRRKKPQTGSFPDFKRRIQARFGDRMLTKADVSWLDEATKSAF